MPGITNPAEEYFKDGLWGWVTDQWKKLVADASGFLKINFAAQDIDVEVTQTDPTDMLVGTTGWDGSAWRRQPLVWGYSERYLEMERNETASAGGNSLTFSTVPAGEVWVATSLVAVNLTSASDLIVVTIYGAGDAHWVDSKVSPAQKVAAGGPCHIVLQADDYLRADFEGCTAGDDIIAFANGYKMSLAE